MAQAHDTKSAKLLPALTPRGELTFQYALDCANYPQKHVGFDNFLAQKNFNFLVQNKLCELFFMTDYITPVRISQNSCEQNLFFPGGFRLSGGARAEPELEHVSITYATLWV